MDGDEANKCEICGENEFNLNNGFYFCNECGTQSQKIRQLEIEDEYGKSEAAGPQAFQVLENISKKKANKGVTLTTWEELNFILIGLVDELIELGAKKELKLTTLQLWASYLRTNEVAFFSKTHFDLPKLGANYTIRDARILYKQKRKPKPKTKRKRSAGSVGSSSVPSKKSAKQISRLKRKLQKAVYEENRTSSEASEAVTNVSAQSIRSEESDKSIPLEFSRHARRRMKRTMPKSHFQKHELDEYRSLTCHNKTSHRRYKIGETVSRCSLFSILCLALNQIDDNIQMGDVIRCIKDGHISYYDVKKFFPLELPVNIDSINTRFHQSGSPNPNSYELRKDLLPIAKKLHVDMRLPNISELCKRYVKELCLPLAIHQMIDTLIAICPPQVRSVNSFKYECRAMAYIIFIMKWLFGFDGEREEVMSKSAMEANRRIEACDPDRSKIFVCLDWIRYLTMRTVIIGQCHHPTAIYFDRNSFIRHTNVYVDYLDRMTSEENEDIRDPVKLDDYQTGQPKYYTKLREIFDNIRDQHDDNLKSRFKYEFPFSLTPQKSNFEYLIQIENTGGIHIPAFMYDKPNEWDIGCFFEPKKLREFFRKHATELLINRNKCNFDNMTFCKRNRLTVDAMNPDLGTFMQYKFDISEQEWMKKLKERQRIECKSAQAALDKIHENLMNENKNRLLALEQVQDEAKARKKERKLEKKRNDKSDNLSFDVECTTENLRPRRNYDPVQNIFNEVSSDEDDDQNNHLNDHITLETSAFDCWMNMLQHQHIGAAKFQQCKKRFPPSFRWLLEQCAFTIQAEDSELYFELIIVEDYFTNALKPFCLMETMLLFQENRESKQSKDLY